MSGVILGALYMLDVAQKVFFGPSTNPKNEHLEDLNARERRGLIPLVAMIFVIGLFPTYFRDRIDPTVRAFLAVYNSKREALASHRTEERPYLLEESAIRPPERDTPPTDGAAPAAEGTPTALRVPTTHPRARGLTVAMGD